MSLIHLPHPSDFYPPTQCAYSTNADDALYVQQFLPQWHSSTEYCLEATRHSLMQQLFSLITCWWWAIKKHSCKSFYLSTIMIFFFSFFLPSKNLTEDQKYKPSERFVKCLQYLRLINECKCICTSYTVSKTKAQRKWEKEGKEKGHCNSKCHVL